MRRVSGRLRRTLLLAVLALSAGVAWGQQMWTVQTVALRDLRQAQAAVGQLAALGFDAYDEFAMNDGHQFVRVRVGCYTDKEAAAAAAQALAGRVTEQAVPVPMSPDAKVARCVEEDVGFLKPGTWHPVQRADGLPAYRVSVAGLSAELVFDGRGWHVLQSGSAPFEPTPAGTAASFVKARPGGAAWVAEELPVGARLLCPGTLVAQVGDAVVVDRPNEVVACHFTALPARLAGDGAP